MCICTYLCIDARLALFMVGYLKLRWILEWPLHLVLLWAISIQFLQYWQTYFLLHFCISWIGTRKKEQNWISDFFHGVNYFIEPSKKSVSEKVLLRYIIGQPCANCLILLSRPFRVFCYGGALQKFRHSYPELKKIL